MIDIRSHAKLLVPHYFCHTVKDFLLHLPFWQDHLFLLPFRDRKRPFIYLLVLI